MGITTKWTISWRNVSAGLAAMALIAFAALFAGVCVRSAGAQVTASSNYVERPEPVATTGARNSESAADPDRPALQARNSRYRFCASDVISLTFPLTPEYSQTVSVQPDGFITLAGAGDIHVEGLTTRETVPAIQAAYVNILHNSIVTIELKDFNKPYFIVGGQVFHPGKFDGRRV
jgi:protein involved in polysaccharide export with SLBB domain